MALLNHGTSLFSTKEDQKMLDEIKKSYCYLSLDFHQECEKFQNDKSLEKTLATPDGKTVTIGSEQFRSPEIYFSPNLFPLESGSIQEVVRYSIMKCDFELRPEFYRNVVLSGGASMFRGFQHRLEQELTQLETSSAVKVISPVERFKSSWMGASIFASLDGSQQMLVDKSEYDEHGPNIIHVKCF